MKRPPDRLTILILVFVLLASGLVISSETKTHAARTTNLESVTNAPRASQPFPLLLSTLSDAEVSMV